MNDLSMKESEYFNEKSDFLKKRILFSRKNNPTLKQSLFGIYKEENENYNKNKAIKNQYDKLKNVMNKSDLMIKKINYIKDMEINSRDEGYGKDLDKYFINRFVNEYNNDKYKGRIIKRSLISI